MSNITRAREIAAKYPNITRYDLATLIKTDLGISRNYARVLVNTLDKQPKPRGGKRLGAGRKSSAVAEVTGS